MQEFAEARLLANRVLDEPGRDPDDDLSTLARQLLRRDDHVEHFVKALRSIAANTCCDSCREAALVAHEALTRAQGVLPETLPVRLTAQT